MRGKVRPEIIRTGQFLEQDAAGFFIPLDKPETAAPVWDGILASARDCYIAEYGSKLHSLYVRGSVALGRAIPGSSDLDMIGLLHHNSFRDKYYAWHHVSWEASFSRTLNAELGFHVQPDLIIASLNCGFLQRNNGLPAVLATQSICIYGIDIREQLPRFAPDQSMMYYNGRMKLFILDIYTRLAADSSPEAVMQSCRKICKAMIRCAFELVLEQERRFTRDLYLCCRVFAKYYPDQAGHAWDALYLYLEPCQDLSQLLSLVADFGHWLVSKERTIELRHRPGFTRRLFDQVSMGTTEQIRSTNR